MPRPGSPARSNAGRRSPKRCRSRRSRSTAHRPASAVRALSARRMPQSAPMSEEAMDPTATTGFDPRRHRVIAEQRWFDDLRMGERFVLPSRTMTEAIFLAFQAASGDNHPIHYDVEYCRSRGLPHMLAHGFQVMIQTAVGAGVFAHMIQDSLKAFIE